MRPHVLTFRGGRGELYAHQWWATKPNERKNAHLLWLEDV
jgi:hypothetical protein